MDRQDDPEDVLSSIRRLVAGEDSPAQGDMRDASPILLLGPAVRVDLSVDPSETIQRQRPERSDARTDAAVRSHDIADATLRALVAEVVREELAGELGQQITRNLRQLVLRELRTAGRTEPNAYD